MKDSLTIFGKDYEIHVSERPDEKKHNRWIAYGNFGGHSLQAYGLNYETAKRKLKERAEIYLDAI